MTSALAANSKAAVATAETLTSGIASAMDTLAKDLDQTIQVRLNADLDTEAMESKLKEAKASGEDMTLALAKATDGEAEPEKQTVYIVFNIAGVLDAIAHLKDSAVSAIRAMKEELSATMHGFADGLDGIIPTKVNVGANLRNAVDTVTTTAPAVQTAAGLSLTLNISTFNNYSTEDIQQLTNEIMVTAGQFAKRKGVVYA
jgi:hypothetical protein